MKNGLWQYVNNKNTEFCKMDILKSKYNIHLSFRLNILTDDKNSPNKIY